MCGKLEILHLQATAYALTGFMVKAAKSYANHLNSVKTAIKIVHAPKMVQLAAIQKSHTLFSS